MLSVTDPTAIRLTDYNITITPANWTTVATVNVSAVDNRTAGSSSVCFSTVSADADFNNITVPDLQFTVAAVVRLGLGRRGS